MICQIILLGFLALATAVNTERTLPKLELPWGIWQATVYEQDPQIYLFRNVRFGAPPERFSRPFSPDWQNSTLQNITQNIDCIQIKTSRLSNPPGGRTPLGDPIDDGALQTEDCLFLDIYAPVSAFQSDAALLPVVVWIYGGGFAFGGKNQMDPLYTGRSLLRASNYQTIFITGNYRVGAFGWLSGHYMQKAGQPNAGLYDQALLLEWVQKYVDRVKGDKARVSAWGESAGGGSILHHLIREDGTQDPLFSTFAVQSPAFQWAWDNSPNGELDNVYRNFSKFANCGYEYNIDCLRAASVEDLTRANQKLFENVKQTGLFPVGPAVDGKWIKSIPTLAFSRDKFWKGIKSAIISHCANEPYSFTPKNIDNETRFDELIYLFLPGPDLEPQRDAVKRQYDCKGRFEGDFHKCAATIIRDMAFTCNTRDLFNSYSAASYMMEYAFPLDFLAVHASDVIPLYANNAEEIVEMLSSFHPGADQLLVEMYAVLIEIFVRKIYQDYFASFSLSGDPNKGFLDSPSWPVADGSNDQLSHVMKVGLQLGPVFHLGEDDQNMQSTCSFWTELAKSITGVPPPVDNDGEIRVQVSEAHSTILRPKRDYSGRIGPDNITLNIKNGPKIIGSLDMPVDPASTVSGSGTWAQN